MTPDVTRRKPRYRFNYVFGMFVLRAEDRNFMAFGFPLAIYRGKHRTEPY